MLAAISLVLSVVSGLLWGSGAARAQPTVPAEVHELVWGFSEFPPFKMKDGGGFTGIDVGMLELLTQHLGLTLRIVECPLPRCLAYMESGTIDVMTSLARRSEREVYMDFLEPAYNSTGIRIYVRQDFPLTIDTYDDLYKIMIGVKQGATYFERFDKDKKIHREVADSLLTNLKKLERGRVDGVINTMLEADYVIATSGFSAKVKKAAFSGPVNSSYIAMSRKSKLLNRRAEIQDFIAKMVATGKIAEIRDRYMSKSASPAAK